MQPPVLPAGAVSNHVLPRLFFLFHLEQQYLINAVILYGYYKNVPAIRLPRLIRQVDCIEYTNMIVENV